MSTVQNILDGIKSRIGTHTATDVIWQVNTAIRLVAKRCYVARSNLVRSQFSLSFGVEDNYKALPSGFWGLWANERPWQDQKTYHLLPIPFKANDNTVLKYRPKTYDSNQGSLAYDTGNNEFDDDGQDFSDWENDGTGGTVYKIVVTNDDATETWAYMGAAAGANLSIKCYQDVDLGTAGFNGAAPGAKTPSTYEVQYQYRGTPKFYELVGTNLWIYPVSSSAITVKGFYFAMPTELTAGSDTMPYGELFDDAIAEFIVKHIRSGGTGADIKVVPAALIEFLNRAVDDVLALHSAGAAKDFPDAIDWESLM